MGKNSTASALKEPISAATPSSGRKPSNASGLINTGGSRQNALSTKAASSQINENMATSNEVVLKSGWMTKRSQLKSIFSFTNYRERYFQLTKSALVYFDNAPPITQGSSNSGKNKRERGRVNIRDIRVVETVTIKDRNHGGSKHEDKKYANSFQIGYRTSSRQYSTKNNQHNNASNIPEFTLVVIARSDVERDEWIASIRNLCRTNLHLSDKYHPTIAVSAARWLCCGDSTVVSRNSSLSGGCQPITWTPRQSKCDPVPPLPQDIRSSPRVVNNSSTSQLHSSKQDLDEDDGVDDNDEVDSFDLTPELQHVGIHGDKTNTQAANNNIGGSFMDSPGTVPQQSVHGNINHVSSPTSPASGANTVGAGVGVPVMPGGGAGVSGGNVVAGGTGKIVVAVYPFTAIEEGDLTLTKGEEYVVLDDSQDHWWEVRNSRGEVGFIPSNYVKELDALGLQNFDWYVADISRQRAESMLKNEDKEGCFVVRNSSTPGLYTLSLYTKLPHPQVKHYHIKQNPQGGFFLSEKHCCASIPELIEYHSYNAGGLACRLKCPPGRSKPPTAGLSHGKWEVDPTELTLMEELGSGQFGVVRRAKWKGTIDVAVKMMKEGTMSEDDFIEEAKLMTRLQHINLVQLYGVCSKNRPIFIITEYMKHGSLLHFLRRHKSTLSTDVGALLDIALQVCRGMAYLERHNYIHRDLAARNCLVGSENVVKVADFGLARYVIDDQYTSNGGAKFPIKWSPPEVLNYTRFSSKSDVWAFGVLCWEIMTCGEMPYGRAKNPEVVERVQRGQILSRPPSCPHKVYDIMRLSWAANPDDRPAFRTIKEQLIAISQALE